MQSSPAIIRDSLTNSSSSKVECFANARAAEMAKFLPSIMMFVKSTNGLSHCKEEDTPEADLEAGISAFLRLVDKVVNA